MVLLDLLTLGLWSKLGRLTHYAFDAVLISTILAGMQRSTGLTLKRKSEDKSTNEWIDKYLGVGEWVMDQSVAIAGSSGWFERRR
ncbi:DUF1748-domain-containing protein [Podospora australis]|uniref:DUF1748-domain-containing protein n=1 Tax=Podospora australis TaxID=1536484 RepID=A0AAN6WL13_9PEZI|nr:DUF1748-domain-containing protein [Podospora australis]